MKKKIAILLLLFCSIQSSIYAQDELPLTLGDCRVTVYENSQEITSLNVSNSSETFTLNLTTDISCSSDYYAAVNYFGDPNEDWITLSKTVFSRNAVSLIITIAANQTPLERTANLAFTQSELGSSEFGIFLGWIQITQAGNSNYNPYYLDSDGDGFGDFNINPSYALSSPGANYVENNLDYCPNEYSVNNNGCIDAITDNNFNWTKSYVYNRDGKLIGASKGYFDDLGKGFQSQSYDPGTNKIWATQTMYDAQGRPALQTMSAPITEEVSQVSFGYKEDFVRNFNGDIFTSSDFESATINIEDPTPVSSQPNTLGAYYSSSGPEFQDTTNRPYSRTIYSELNPGAVKQTIGGNKMNGAWKQGYSFSMVAAQEMEYVFGYDYFENTPAIASTYELDNVATTTIQNINWLKATKTVVEDVHGNEAVIFTDTDGKTLGAARSGTPENPSEEVEFEVLSLIGSQNYVDIHIPKGCENTLSFIGNSSDYKVYNLKTETPFDTTPTTLSKGFYRIEYTGSIILKKEHQLTYVDGTTIKPVLDDAAVGVRYNVNYYDFSLNYYNQIGQLTASLQPVYFNKNCLTGLSSLVNYNEAIKSTFTYDTLGQLVSTTSPDEGTANFKYREDGQIRFSQNSKQLVASSEEFSYTNYDELGRPIESGVAKGTFSSLDPDTLTFTSTSKREQHFTVYDYLDGLHLQFIETNVDSPYDTPSFLSGNVAKTYNLDDNGNEISATYYSYDVYGRVTWIVQNFSSLGIKTTDYEYDPITSQVSKVIYQKNDASELFIHKYTYDEDTQELIKVETSTNGTNYTTHADYEYYETGALKRTELAGGLQGIDYVYNLAGQLKGINHPDLTSSKDPGGDSTDLFGLSLHYYGGDYQRDSRFLNNITNAGTNQYNGNIKGISWNTNITGNVDDNFSYLYEYNNNNWLTSATFSAGTNTQSNASPKVYIHTEIASTFNAEATEEIILQPGFEAIATTSLEFSAKIVNANTNGTYATDDYKVYGLEYDANGNIEKLNRNKNTENETNEMDKLTYRYDNPNKPNQLTRVEDAVKNPTNADDIKDQTTTENYKYNAIGQLTTNEDERVGYEYNASGLVTKVFYNNTLKVAFYYNDKNFRTRKVSYAADGETIENTTDYIRDVAGSVLAIYEDEALVELPIYGASRLGIYKKETATSVYQLSDHLGNVRAVIAKDDNGNAMALTSATDYYPFGMPMPNRKFGANGYRYAYQGQEVDPETGKEAFQLRLWDARIGRWLTTDPKHEFASPYLGMGNNPINLVDPDGGSTAGPDTWIKNKKTGDEVYIPDGKTHTHLELSDTEYNGVLDYLVNNGVDGWYNPRKNENFSWNSYWQFTWNAGVTEAFYGVASGVSMAMQELIVQGVVYLAFRGVGRTLPKPVFTTMVKPPIPKGLNGEAQTMPRYIYRGGGKSPSNFKLRPGEEYLSFSEGMANPTQGHKVFTKSEAVMLDAHKLPEGSIILDGGLNGFASGHVSVKASTEQIQAAIVQKIKFPK